MVGTVAKDVSVCVFLETCALAMKTRYEYVWKLYVVIKRFMIPVIVTGRDMQITAWS
jgi:hypothetical protein